jgi:hypothetical protein
MCAFVYIRMDAANEYEWRDIAEMLAIDDDDRLDDILALSRAGSRTRVGCHEAIRGHLARSEERYIIDSKRGAVVWFNERERRSRYCDRPAVIRRDGMRCWYRSGRYHRDAVDPMDPTGRHLPAIIREGDCEWCRKGRCHRDDVDSAGLHLPARIIEGDWCSWDYDGRQHRDDMDPDGISKGLGPLSHLPAMIYESGDRVWFRNGDRHNDDVDPRTGFCMPAIIYADGSRIWMRNDVTRRDDVDATGRPLPSVINGDGTCE